MGLGMVLVANRSNRSVRATSASRRSIETRAALAAYLREHLSGSDSACLVVRRLRHAHAGSELGRLFAALAHEFREERDVVRWMLREMGASPRSLKRLVAQAAGPFLASLAGGRRGDPALFRTLEALAIGVQGKRLMWRALRTLPNTPTPVRSFAELEAMAVRQWEAIERQRQSLASNTFSSAESPDLL